MRETDIKDSDIPNADPEKVIIQYSGLIKKIAKSYSGFVNQTGAFDIDDLIQAGMIAILEAQKKYDPEKGMGFTHFCSFYLRNLMRRTIGIGNDGNTDPVPIPLDKPLLPDEDGTGSIIDLIPDPTANTEENYIEKEHKEEISREVREALLRLRNENQREAIRRVYLENQDRETVASDLGIDSAKLNQILYLGKHQMSRDFRLIRFIKPFFSTSIKLFRRTWASSVEAEILWKEAAYNRKFGEGAFLTMPDPDKIQKIINEDDEEPPFPEP